MMWTKYLLARYRDEWNQENQEYKNTVFKTELDQFLLMFMEPTADLEQIY